MATIEIKTPADRYKAIADAIREKSGTTELMQPADMPQMIMELSGGAEYTDITYNEDNTITLTDKDGVVHTMECEFSEGGKLIAVSYDGKAIELTYDGDLLVKVGKTAVDVANAQISGIEPLDHTVKFMVDGEPYEVVSVKDGNSVNEPSKPTKEGYSFGGWNDNEGNIVSFPITPTQDLIINGSFKEVYADQLYSLYDINKEEYPYVAIIRSTNRNIYIAFCEGYSNEYKATDGNGRASSTNIIQIPDTVGFSPEETINWFINQKPNLTHTGYCGYAVNYSDVHAYTNIPFGDISPGTLYII